MNPVMILQMLSLVDAVLALTQRIGIGLEEYRQLKAKAASEGREVSVEDVRELIGDAQDAIDQIGQ